MMDYRYWKQHQEELLREAERRRLARALRAARERRAGRAWFVFWEIRRFAGRLLKSLKTL